MHDKYILISYDFDHQKYETFQLDYLKVRTNTCFLKSIVQHKNCNDSNEYLFDAQIRFSMYCAVNDYAVLKRVERAEVRHI